MTTLEKLQAHLATKRYTHHGFDYKDNAPLLECSDGFSMSVQASWAHYCAPCNNVGPYTHVETWLCGTVPEWSEYGDGEDPYARVPVELVAQVIDQHGGFKE